jgi:DNA repair protein RadD
MSGFELRDYQSHLVDRIRSEWASGSHRVLACLPTGGGKSEVAISILLAQATPGHRALVIVDRKNLCGQWVERIQRHAPGAMVGILQGDNTNRVYASILIATAQTIRRRGVPEDVGLVVVDESHIWHKTHDEVLSAVGTANVLGLTATPLREGLGKRFDKLVIGTTIRDLIASGHLVQPRYFAPKHGVIESALQAVRVQAGDFATADLSKQMRTKAIIGDVVGSWQQHADGRQTIAFCVDKQHAHELADEFTAAGITARSIVDDTLDDERKQIFADFDACRLQVMCSVGVLAVGFDSPIASCAIMARPTLSLSLYVQQGGRVLRPHASKADCIILDHAGNTTRHGLLEDFIPPADLSLIDKTTDKKSRKERATAWVCRHCEAVNANADDTCTECGTPRRRTSAVYVVDGELMPLYSDDPRTADVPSVASIRDFYLQCVWYATAKTFRNPHGWAYHKTIERFHVDNPKSVIAWGWRDLAPVRPTDAAARWIKADWQRQVIARKYETSLSR